MIDDTQTTDIILLRPNKGVMNQSWYESPCERVTPGNIKLIDQTYNNVSKQASAVQCTQTQNQIMF